MWGGEVDDGLGGWVIAPGADGIEIGEEIGREADCDGLAGEFCREAVGEVLEHDESDEDGVARGPRGGGVAENAELEGEVGALEGDGGVDATGVELDVVELLGGEGGDGAVGGGAELEDALDPVVLKEFVAEDFGEFAGGVAAEEVHLEETILRSDEALSKDEVVEGGGADVGNAVGVALDGYGSREAWEGERAVDLREFRGEQMTDVASRGKESGDAEDQENRAGDGEELQETARTARFVLAAARTPRK